VELLNPSGLKSNLGLGLTLWAGEFEWQSGLWLRWCEAVKVISMNRTDLEEQRANPKERQRANKQNSAGTGTSGKKRCSPRRLRAMGINLMV